MAKPDAPTGIDDKRCAIDMAIIRECLRRMEVTLYWGPTSLILGDALTKDNADATDLMRACVRASTDQLADESSTLQRAREEREAWSSAKADGEVRDHGKPTVDADVHTRVRQHGRAVQPFVEERKKKSDAEARSQHEQCPSHDDDTSDGQDRADVDGPGERRGEVLDSDDQKRLNTTVRLSDHK